MIYGVRDALQARDVNRLAAYYHWTGMGSKQGYAVMTRLGALTDRYLVDIQLVSSEEQEAAVQESYSRAAELQAGFKIEGEAPAAPARPRPPDMLRVDHMRRDDLETDATYFRLRMNAGCWWLSL